MRRSVAAVCAVLAVLLAGCGNDGKSSYTNSEIKAKISQKMIRAKSSGANS